MDFLPTKQGGAFVTSLKHIIMFNIMVLFITAVPIGCGSQGTTTVFKWTPIGSMEDEVTTPERLSSELEDQRVREDVKRMKRLQENAKRESMIQKTPIKSVKEATPEEVKGEVEEATPEVEKSEVQKEAVDSGTAY